MRKWLKNVIYAGHIDENSAEVRKQILLSSLFSLISFLLLIIYGADNLAQSNDQLATVVLVCALVSGINYLVLCRTGNYVISSFVVVLLMTILCLYLISTGGNLNTGPLWSYILPSFIFYIFGLRIGVCYLLVVFTLILYILFYPDTSLLTAHYSPVFLKRFLGSFLSVTIIAYVYEYSREDGRRELLNLSRKLDHLSRRDELTNLSNRRDMFERLRNELERFERSGRLFSVLIADIDQFKVINDTHGHECGDGILKKIADVFRANTQKRDGVARWGGEEFLIFLPETNGEQARITAERLRQAIELFSFSYKDNEIRTTISIGVAEYFPGQTLNELINNADNNLYAAKRDGRNTVRPSL